MDEGFKVIAGAVAVLILVSVVYLSLDSAKTEAVSVKTGSGHVRLPKPVLDSNTSVEAALNSRRSIRGYGNSPLSARQLSQVLWSAQGITDERGYRTAPSAGETYPLKLYVLVGRVSGIPPGLYRYHPDDHGLSKVLEGDLRKAVSDLAFSQSWMVDAQAILLFTAMPERTERRYGDRAARYVHMEAGHAAQNVYLQCESLGLGTVVVGAFDDKGLKILLNLVDDEVPLYLQPVGVV